MMKIRKNIFSIIILIILSINLLIVILQKEDMQEMESVLMEIESMAEATSIVFYDGKQEVIKSDPSNIKIKELLPISTFTRKYDTKIKKAKSDMTVSVSFYKGKEYLNYYDIVSVNTKNLDEEISNRVFYFNGTPCFVIFQGRYWTLGKDKNIVISEMK